MASEEPRSQLEDLQAVTDAALSYLPLNELLDELLTRVRDILDVDTAAILLIDDDRRALVARAAKGLEEEVEAVVRVPLGVGFAGRVAAEVRPVHIPDVSTADLFNPLLREKGLRSLLGVPLIAEGAVTGVMHVGSLGDRHLHREGRRPAAARRRPRRARHSRPRCPSASGAWPRSSSAPCFLQTLPSFPGARVAARYSPAASAPLGGDWYDAFITRTGMLCMAIGDVVGRGFRAAAVMAQLRSGLRAYALEEREPLELIERLNTLVRQLEPGRTATLVYIVVDPLTSGIEVVAAANAPPVLISPDGEATLLELPPAPPLGATASPNYRLVEGELTPGLSAAPLHRRAHRAPRASRWTSGSERLIEATSGYGGTVDRFCQHAFDALLPEEGPRTMPP